MWAMPGIMGLSAAGPADNAFGKGRKRMKDFPVFTTEYGVASLILKEIPYQEIAYVIIQDALEPEKLIAECRNFCRICGARQIYAKGHAALESRPLYTALWEMRCQTRAIPDTDAALWPVQEQTIGAWRKIYNEKVKRIPNGAWMTEADGADMLRTGDGYFIHREKTLLGIGRASGGRIDLVAAVQPGAGRDVTAALAHAVTGDSVSLMVASANEKAIRLYEKLGFIKTSEISRWYCL